MASSYNVAVVGATGAVGRKMIETLEKHNFPVKKLRLLASQRSAGIKLEYKGEEIEVEVLDTHSFEGMDIALFSAGGSISKEFAPLCKKAGCVAVDNSSAWRMDPDVPLIVPEVNPHHMPDYSKKNIIANPNCSTIQMVVALKPLHDEAQIKRVVVSTYQAVSGAGQKGIDELEQQVRDLFNMREISISKFPHQIAFNCLPHIGDFGDNLYTTEEMKMVNETHKMLDPNIKVTATTVRVPVFSCHSESINIEFAKPITVERARELLSKAPGVAVFDNPAKNEYPLGIDWVDREETVVGRIRIDDTVEHGLNIWVVSDNLLKGAASNTVQIAELLAEKYL